MTASASNPVRVLDDHKIIDGIVRECLLPVRSKFEVMTEPRQTHSSNDPGSTCTQHGNFGFLALLVMHWGGESVKGEEKTNEGRDKVLLPHDLLHNRLALIATSSVAKWDYGRDEGLGGEAGLGEKRLNARTTRSNICSASNNSFRYCTIQAREILTC